MERSWGLVQGPILMAMMEVVTAAAMRVAVDRVGFHRDLCLLLVLVLLVPHYHQSERLLVTDTRKRIRTRKEC